MPLEKSLPSRWRLSPSINQSSQNFRYVYGYNRFQIAISTYLYHRHSATERMKAPTLARARRPAATCW